jgi:hypothetical protein
MNRFLSRWGPWVLLAFALIYYGQYYRAGLYPAAEGGVEGMIALRLMEGQRPLIDTFLGYNLLWFYPVVGLFKVFGASYTVLRLFFFFLCLLTGLMSFRIVRLVTGNASAAFLAGFLVLLIPGQMFRNYMAFMVMLNLLVFLSAFILPAHSNPSRLFWMAAGGFSLAIAWLLRVDVGFFLTCIWIGLVIIYPFRSTSLNDFLRQARTLLLGATLAISCFLAFHLPFYLDASQRGFGSQFVAQYEQWPAMINFQGRRLLLSATGFLSESFLSLSHKTASPASEAPLPAPTPAPTSITPSSALLQSTSSSTDDHSPAIAFPSPLPAKKAPTDPSTLSRRSFSSDSARDRMLAFNLYLPIALALFLSLGAGSLGLYALFCHKEPLRDQCLALLTALACSLTLFPQYFFWRPDMVHLSEFMVPLTVTIVISCTLLLSFWNKQRLFLRIIQGFYFFTAGLTLLLYYINACQSQSSGGIAAGQHKRLEFRAAHGVNVLLSPHEYQDASAITGIISAASSPGEFLICYPYNPEINFMTARPSYEYNFYVDNAMIPSDTFYKETVEKIEKFKPVAFVIIDWPINNTEESKFKCWAVETYGYIANHYSLAYRHGNLEVFVRPDRISLIPEAYRNKILE